MIFGFEYQWKNKTKRCSYLKKLRKAVLAGNQEYTIHLVAYEHQNVFLWK